MCEILDQGISYITKTYTSGFPYTVTFFLKFSFKNFSLPTSISACIGCKSTETFSWYSNQQSQILLYRCINELKSKTQFKVDSVG